MSPSVKAVTLFAPVVATNAVFAPRRLSRSVDAMEEDHHLYGLMNLDIAAGQTLKGIKAGAYLLAMDNPAAKDSILKFSNNIKALENKSKLFKSLNSVLDFTSRNINPIIYTTSGVKVLTSDKKDEALTEEISGIGIMRCSEELASDIMGMPSFKYNKATKTMESINKEGLYKNNPFLNKQVEAFKDFCDTKKIFNNISLKSLPSIVKGCLFVGASIGGYALGSNFGKILNGKPLNNKTKKSNTDIALSNTQTNSSTYTNQLEKGEDNIATNSNSTQKNVTIATSTQDAIT